MPSLVSILSFIIGVSALLVDELLTKIGLKMGCRERNRVFNFLTKKIEEKYVHCLLTVTGSLMLLCLLVLYDNSLLLMFFALALNAPVIVNALTLWKVSRQNQDVFDRLAKA
jgi:hypothetical protein